MASNTMMSHQPQDALPVCETCNLPIPLGAPAGLCPNCLCSLLLEPNEGAEGNDVPQDLEWMMLGDYSLREEIGRGGMGTVYRAIQQKLKRPVAVKVLRGGELASIEARKRFRAEAENVARLKHPGIAAIYDVGEEHGVCWFAMELLEGQSLDSLVRLAPMEGYAAAQLLLKIADALQHAHESGVLHRDLKPSNVMLGTDGSPRITDFGISQRIDGSLTESHSRLTTTGQSLGSPSYAAPEQVLQGQANTRTDVYGLGAVLYHLLTSRPPFQGPTVDSVLMQLRENEPLPPRRLNPSIPTDLETICLKSLRRDPVARYQSAADFSADVQRFLNKKPILAKPPSLVSLVWWWMKRHPGTAALLMLLILSVSVAFGMIDHARRNQTQARFAEREAKDSAVAKGEELRLANNQVREILDTTDIMRAEDFFARQQRDKGLATLAKVLRRTPEHSVAGPRLASAFYQGGTAMPELPPFVIGEKIVFLRLINNDKELLIGTDQGAFIRDLATGRELRQFSTNNTLISHYALSPDGKWLAGWWNRRGLLIFWDMADGRIITPIIHHSEEITDATFTRDGTMFLTACGGAGLIAYDVGTSKQVAPAFLDTQPAFVCAINEEGSVFAVGSDEGIRIWDTQTRIKTRLLRPSLKGLCQLKFSPNGNFLAVGGKDGQVELFNLKISDSPQWKIRHAKEISALEFSITSNRLLTASFDNTARVWHARDGLPLSEQMRHLAEISQARFDQDSKFYVLTVGFDNTVRLWHAYSGQPMCQPIITAERATDVVITKDRHWLITGGKDGVVQRWRLNGAYRFPLQLSQAGEMLDAQWSPTGDLIATTASGLQTMLWDAFSGEIRGKHDHLSPALDLVFAPQPESQIALPSSFGGASLYNADASFQEVKAFRAEGFNKQGRGAFSPDGLFYACLSTTCQLGVWSTVTGQLHFPIIPSIKSKMLPVRVEFSPDGSKLLVVSISDINMEDEAYVRDSQSGKVFFELKGHSSDILDACFSPDGKWLVTAGNDNLAFLWNVESGSRVGLPMKHTRSVRTARFSPDSNLIATGSSDRTARLWEVPSGRPVSAPLAHEDDVTSVDFSPMGNRLATASRDQWVRLWDVENGLIVGEPLYHQFPVERASFSPNGERLLSVTNQSSAYVWEVPQFAGQAPPWLVDLAEIFSTPDLDGDSAKVMALINRYLGVVASMKETKHDSVYYKISKRLETLPQAK